MKFEAPYAFENSDAEILKTINEIQMELMKRLFGFTPSDEDQMKWVTKYSKMFRDIANSHHDIILDYAIENKKESALDRIEALLYKHEQFDTLEA
ncbi:MAG: hypothetical protein A2928_04260 [Candidatus Taylorbacteria bacterium RIFCSPLOWO2_01_FULL_45_15b]|uniref:Uncharacterized protein n=1 Tax=Candidatus Taylorbacteria bacterium RIFCSPLOWO2_01_FULL_45_15b TaxID=1802319 RepID=A0A1G2NEM1_9BACT|nr:MAG: hypothetical protein A2928_04260 [Candidatus Taylorbacteria bacterium RIFCSPLOWO2_01_FULL_45_15b]